MSKREAGRGVSKREITSLVRKLERWAEDLPPNERALAQVIASRARDIGPADIVATEVSTRLEESLESIVGDVRRQVGVDYWDKIGPIWQKANEPEKGEEVMITATIQIRPKAPAPARRRQTR